MTKSPSRLNLLSDIRSLRRLWPYLREYRWFVVFGALLIPVIAALQTALPIVLKNTIDHGIAEADHAAIARGAAIYLALVVGDYMARSGQTMLLALAVHRMVRVMRMALIEHVLRLSAAYHDRSMSGATVTRATSDFDNLSESLNQGVLSSIVDIAMLLGAIVGLFVLSWKLALVALVILPLVGFVVSRFSRALKQAMLAARVKIAALNAFTQECLYGSATVKLLTAEREADERFGKLAVEYRDAQMRSVVLDAVMFAVLDGIASITVGIVLWFAVTYVTGSDALSAGLMVAFVQYIQNLFEPLKQLGNKIAMLQGVFTSLERIFGIFDTHEFIGGARELPSLAGRVEFRGVTFRYRSKEAVSRPVLDDVSFTLEPGTSLAIVGPTGSGKSTIIKLLSKLYSSYEGEIIIDGQDLAALDGRWLRRHMAIVPQDIVLFDGSIAFNIGLDIPGIGQDAIEAAARAVGADEFIAKLPGGYDFVIKEQGANLSHGQRQLIAFARALAKDPALVILDEATSAVDPASEQAIQQAIDRILEGRSVIVIAHRLSTIQKCDQILVVSRGHIVESGDHGILMKRRGAYYELHQALV